MTVNARWEATIPRNGSGTYTLPQPAFVPGTTISSSAVNSDLSDIASQITNSLAADGQTAMTGQIKGLPATAAAPGYAFTTDLTTGMYHTSDPGVGFAVSGVAVVKITSAGITTPSGLVLSGVQVGTVVDFAGSSAPSLWLLCYGQAISRTTYSSLFSVINTTWGVGDGSTTFNIPDMRGRAGFGVDNMGGVAANRIPGATLATTGGAELVTIAQANLPNVNFTNSGITLNDPGHTHNVTADHTGGVNNGVLDTGNAANFTSTAVQTATTGITVSSQGSAASGGSGTGLNVLNPAAVFNKIIFAGV